MGHIQKKKTFINTVAKSLSFKYLSVQQDYTKAELRLQEELGRSRRAFSSSIAEVKKLNGQILEEQTYLLNIAEVQVVSRSDYLTMRVKQSDIALLGEDGGGNDEEELDLGSSLNVLLKLQEPRLEKTEHTKALEVGQLTTKPCTVNTDEDRSFELGDGAVGGIMGTEGATGIAELPLDLYRDIDMITAM